MRDRDRDQCAAARADRQDDEHEDQDRRHQPDHPVDQEGAEALSVVGELDRERDPFRRDDLAPPPAHAFEELVSLYKPRILAIARRITKNREDAEDVLQDSFHKAFLHLGTFQEKSRFSTWLTSIARNEAFMTLRRRRGILDVLPENPNDSLKSSAEAFIDKSPSPEESCWRLERTEHLINAINCLRPRIRRTILLHNIEGRSLQEIAQVLGISIAAVKARVFQGRRKLRRTLNPKPRNTARTTRLAGARYC